MAKKNVKVFPVTPQRVVINYVKYCSGKVMKAKDAVEHLTSEHRKNQDWAWGLHQENIRLRSDRRARNELLAKTGKFKRFLLKILGLQDLLL